MPVWISALSHVLPQARQTPPAGIENEAGYFSVAYEAHRPAGRMAIEALQGCIDQIGKVRSSNVASILHASIYDQGMGVFWNPGAALQSIAGAIGAQAISLRQGCNGLMVALESGAQMVDQRQKEVIIVGSDRFHSVEFDRFSADYDIMYGDAAVCCLLSPVPGSYRLLDIKHISAPTLAALHDGSGLEQCDIRAAKKRYLNRHGKDLLTHTTRVALMQLNQKFKDQTIDRILFPNLGRKILQNNYFPCFDRAEARSAMDLGLRVGHLGTSDQLIALAHLQDHDELSSGDRVLLLGAGSGFSWSGVLIEVS